MRIRKWWLMNQDGGGDGSGSGSGGAGGAGDSAGNAGRGDSGGAGSQADAGSDAGEASLLAAAAGGGDQGGEAGAAADKGGDGKALTPEQKAEADRLKASEKDTRRPKHVPAKYWDAEKGEIRAEAAFKSLSELEGRMRDVGLPPADPSAYKFEVPKEYAEAGLDLDPDLSAAFRKEAHEAGLSQKQYEWVMGTYFKQLGSLVDHAGRAGKELLQKELLEHYKTPEVLNENLKHAFRVVNAFGDEAEVKEAMGARGNVPAWVYRVLAKVGKELGEDPGFQSENAGAEGESLETLMAGKPGDENSPYWNPKHPQHARTVEKVQRIMERQAAAAKRKQAA